MLPMIGWKQYFELACYERCTLDTVAPYYLDGSRLELCWIAHSQQFYANATSRPRRHFSSVWWLTHAFDPIATSFFPLGHQQQNGRSEFKHYVTASSTLFIPPRLSETEAITSLIQVYLLYSVPWAVLENWTQKEDANTSSTHQFIRLIFRISSSFHHSLNSKHELINSCEAKKSNNGIANKPK